MMVPSAVQALGLMKIVQVRCMCCFILSQMPPLELPEGSSQRLANHYDHDQANLLHFVAKSSAAVPETSRRPATLGSGCNLSHRPWRRRRQLPSDCKVAARSRRRSQPDRTSNQLRGISATVKVRITVLGGDQPEPPPEARHPVTSESAQMAPQSPTACY